MCFYHFRANHLSEERNLSDEELSCLHGCNGKETCEGENVHKSITGDPRFCEGFVSIKEVDSGYCFHKLRVLGMQRRNQPLNGDHKNCFDCNNYDSKSHRDCYLDVKEAVKYDELFHTRSLKSGSHISGFRPGKI